jgi:hypothetical protein
MALLNDELTLWEIGFRWAGLDSNRRWWRIPLPVRDNFRVLVDAISNAQLECVNISNERREEHADALPEFFIRTHLSAIEDCVSGNRYPRSFLQFARLERLAFQGWCQRRNIPLPEFWFPTGWNIDYQWPDADDSAPAKSSESLEEHHVRLDKWHRIQMACQQVALFIWHKQPKLTIKEVALRREIQEQAGGSEAELETVEGWLGKVDPRNPAKKRGPKRKNNSGSEETGP